MSDGIVTSLAELSASSGDSYSVSAVPRRRLELRSRDCTSHGTMMRRTLGKGDPMRLHDIRINIAASSISGLVAKVQAALSLR